MNARPLTLVGIVTTSYQILTFFFNTVLYKTINCKSLFIINIDNTSGQLDIVEAIFTGKICLSL